MPLDDTRRWWRYHHLFGEARAAQLRAEQPELIPTLHRRASVWYEQHDLLGLLLFGSAMFRARIVSRWAAGLLGFSGPLAILMVVLLPHLPEPTWRCRRATPEFMFVLPGAAQRAGQHKLSVIKRSA